MNSTKFLGLTIDSHVSIGHIFTTVAAIVAGVLAYSNMVTRVQILEISYVRMEKTIDDLRDAYQVSLDKIDAKLERIEEKIDSKVDKK